MMIAQIRSATVATTEARQTFPADLFAALERAAQRTAGYLPGPHPTSSPNYARDCRANSAARILERLCAAALAGDMGDVAAAVDAELAELQASDRGVARKNVLAALLPTA